MSNNIPNLIQSLYQQKQPTDNGLSSTWRSSSEADQGLSNNDTKSNIRLSLRSQKLSSISQQFFNGPIASKNIAALTQSLYESGFISGDEFQSMGNQENQTTTITQAKHFVNSFMMQASAQKDTQTQNLLDPIAIALQNMDAKPSPAQRQNEVLALDNSKQVLAKLTEVGANEALISEFENVIDVLSTLDTLRKNDQVNQGVAQYEAVQRDFKDLFED